jgi:hypothetical protein
MTNAPEFRGAMTRVEFQNRSGLGATSFYKEIAAGRLTPVKAGRKTYVTHEEANRWLDALPRWSRAKAPGRPRKAKPVAAAAA